MKKLKKALCLLLVGVVAVTSLICGSVTASAADIPYYVLLSAGDKSNQYYVDICGITDAEMKFLKDSSKHGYSITLTFDKGKSSEILFMYSEVRTDTMSMVLPLFKHNGKFFDVKSAGFTTIGKEVRYRFEFDTSDTRFYVPISELKKCTDCNLTIYQVEGDKSSNYYGHDIDKGVKVPYYSDGKVPAATTKKVSDLTISSIASKAYTGKALKPAVTVKDGSKTLVKGTDYTVSYKNNTNIGKATVTITGKGSYTGTKTVTFKIVPPKTTLTAKKSNGKYALSWKAVDGITKYQVQYSTDGGKTYTSAGTVSSGKTSVNLKLDTSKSYTFRIRSYKSVDGTKYYSSWSKVVTVK